MNKSPASWLLRVRKCIKRIPDAWDVLIGHSPTYQEICEADCRLFNYTEEFENDTSEELEVIATVWPSAVSGRLWLAVRRKAHEQSEEANNENG